MELSQRDFPISFIFIMIANSGITNGTLGQEASFPGKFCHFPTSIALFIGLLASTVLAPSSHYLTLTKWRRVGGS